MTIIVELRTGGTVTPSTDVDEELHFAEEDEDLTGWYCVHTDPWPCPACGTEFEFLTAAHRIVVWPERDDPMLLENAAIAKRLGRNPEVVEYEWSFGPYITYDWWRSLGGPVHGMRRSS